MSSLKSGHVHAQHAAGRCPPIAFRTILKNRNNSLEPAPEAAHSSRSINARLTSLSSTSLPPAPDPKPKIDSQPISKNQEISSKNNIKDLESSIIATPRDAATSRVQVPTSPSEHVSRETPTVEELERRIENLLEGKLSRFRAHRKGVGLTNWGYLHGQAVYSELEAIASGFRSRTSEQGIAELATRLELIEKMLASEAIEAELIKERYHGFTTQRNTASQKKPDLETSAAYNQKSQPKLQTVGSAQTLATVTNFVSTTQEAFSRPSKESYAASRYKHPAYTPNRQVLPRSSYSTEFLKYGAMPTFDCRQMGLQSLPAHASLTVKTSSYQVEFKERPARGRPVDYRELDCYRDKIKNPNISFMAHCKRQMLDASQHLRKAPASKLQTKITAGTKLSKLLAQSSCGDFYKSEQRRNYQGHAVSQSEQLEWPRAVPKNGLLHELKATLRQSYLRG